MHCIFSFGKFWYQLENINFNKKSTIFYYISYDNAKYEWETKKIDLKDLMEMDARDIQNKEMCSSIHYLFYTSTFCAVFMRL